MKYEIISVRDNPDYLETAADYLSSKWKIDRKIYHDSISDSIYTENTLPRWYLMKDSDNIIGAFGLIENDFMVRKDLMPWICAIYIEEHMRGKQLGLLLLEKGKEEARKLGFSKLYLCTDHIGFYEKYGWNYFGDEESEFGGYTRVYVINTTPLTSPPILPSS